MLADANLKLEVVDTAFDPRAPGARKVYRQFAEAKRPLYKVWIFLKGKDLAFVDSVTYTLHRTFDSPVRTVQRSLKNPHCQLQIWTWGVFDVGVSIRDQSGNLYRLVHSLRYDEAFREPVELVDEQPSERESRPVLIARAAP